MGPVPGIWHDWAACGVIADFRQDGGLSLTRAHWMTCDAPQRDVMAMNVDRGPHHLSASCSAQAHHKRWFAPHGTERVTVGNLSDRLTGLQVAESRARDVLETATGAAPGQRFMKAATISIGMAP
jgi:hypothetical protein